MGAQFGGAVPRNGLTFQPAMRPSCRFTASWMA
jgi:hypothetical protein